MLYLTRFSLHDVWSVGNNQNGIDLRGRVALRPLDQGRTQPRRLAILCYVTLAIPPQRILDVHTLIL